MFEQNYENSTAKKDKDVDEDVDIKIKVYLLFEKANTRKIGSKIRKKANFLRQSLT